MSILVPISQAKSQGVDYKRVARKIIRSAAMRDELLRRGKAISQAAGPGHRVTSKVIGDRYRVSVAAWTIDARVAEARDKTLSKALDAARTGKTKGSY
jgi:hypothetical protein